MESARVRDRLDNYYLYHAARADLLRRLNRPTQARETYERALSLTTNTIEQNYIRRRLDETRV
jgi:RNA polymerase sigma-70 factor (ECF subfamily)